MRALASHQCGPCRFKSWYQRHFDIQGWVCCWFSPLLREVFSGYSRFPLFPNTNISKFLFNQESGRWRTSLSMCYSKSLLLFIIIFWAVNVLVLKPRGLSSALALSISSWTCFLVVQKISSLPQLIVHTSLEPWGVCYDWPVIQGFQ